MPKNSVCEPVPIAEQFASGAAFTRRVGDLVFIGLFIDSFEPAGFCSERRLSHRLIMPACAALELSAALSLACGQSSLAIMASANLVPI